jgi:hypothetical protein
MAWEERGRKTYFYRKVWSNGTCQSEYCGQGSIGGLFAHTIGVQHHERTMARLALQDFVQEQRQIDRAIDAYRRELRGIVAATLQALGFHQHRRQWRLRREATDPMSDEIVKDTKSEQAEYLELMQAAEKAKGKGAQGAPAVEKLRAYATAHPAVFDGVSKLARTTLHEVIASFTPNEPTQIHVKGEVSGLQRALGIATATPLEKLLIADVTICWVRLQAMEQVYSANYNTGNGVTFAKAAYLESRLSATRRRYLQSVEALARVRGLLSRVGMQVNIANQQVVQNG